MNTTFDITEINVKDLIKFLSLIDNKEQIITPIYNLDNGEFSLCVDILSDVSNE